MKQMEMTYHTPALLSETLELLAINESGIYVDVTFGGGGHSKAILEQLGANGKLIAFDQDEDAIANVADDERLVFVRSNFRYLKNFLKYHDVEKADGILADLGVSSHHFDDAERGFSFRFDGNLDMRMNKQAAITAADVLNDYSEEKLADVFYFYGEMNQARKIARAIALFRKTEPIYKVSQLVGILQPYFGKDKEKKELAKAFQALRIEVNHEMDALKEFLVQAKDVLKPGGRLAILTYHSLEDRLVKNFFRSGNFEGKIEKDFYGNPVSPFLLVNNRVIVASDEEVNRNPRARSAKLRVAQKK